MTPELSKALAGFIDCLPALIGIAIVYYFLFKD